MYAAAGPSTAIRGRVIHKIGRVLNQLQTSACTGFAATQFLMSHPYFTKIKGDAFDFAYQLYRDGQREDGIAGEEPKYFGTTTEGIYAAMLKRGLVKSAPVWTRSLESILRCLFERGPVMMGTPFYDGMANPKEDGLMTATGKSIGGHEWLFYGADVENEEAFMVNSWGAAWGNQGRGRIAFKEIEKLLSRGGYGTSMIENK